jgi:ABC-2 type transport system permease protein
MEAGLTARRGENLLAILAIPIGVLLFTGMSAPGTDRVEQAVAATLALAIVASGLVNLGIATAYERGYGVLKRLGGSPLGRSGLIAAKAGVVAAIAVGQVVGLLAFAALAFGWRPDPRASVGARALATLLGAATFAGLGLAIAGSLRPETALVVANVLFLVAIAIGGALATIVDIPDPLRTAFELLPVGALVDAFGAAVGSGSDLWRPLAILGAWAVASNAVAARFFHWD